ncbi:hypothetical protein PUNSTDRAFT_134818 [Punctularia strigosozonata HHB-11173 SS5]|uniref:uncharacterized protein n=1 Tax=Punctularia strigosozonata (strain HHB-11173) TaxID=741275 RepID=UPI000441676F|nr:uncharacterized protein PUNSTDRAFT_134818 [Punctularia strigosozonata HHB-11173 SS5]EIN08437.1 hypothetical protein PUNSTDRAFT_134818 [Punctularia strigosozonata HHB-11173 SS5]
MSDCLQLTLPGYPPSRLIRDANISCCPDPIATEAGGTLESLELLKADTYDYVYRAKWTGRTQSKKDRETPLDVVIKLHLCRRILPQELEHEAEMYAHAHETQGFAIPWCYGLFRGSANNDPMKSMAVLVLEYCGKPLTDSKGDLIDFYDLDRDRQLKVVQQTAALHYIGGLEHNDLYPRNVVWTDQDEAVIVDLAHAKKHECKQPKIERFAMIPDIYEFGCDELHDTCLECRMWFSAEMEFVGEVIPARTIHTLEDILRPVQISGEYITQERLEEAERILEEIEFRRKYYPSSLKD